MSNKEQKTFSLRQQRFAYPSSHAAKRIFQRTSIDSLELMRLSYAEETVQLNLVN